MAWRRVEASDIVDWIDRVMRNNFGFGQKTRRKSFPVPAAAAAWWPAAVAENGEGERALYMSMMGEIDISTLTLEQYFRLIEENQASSMVNDEFRGMMEKDIIWRNVKRGDNNEDILIDILKSLVEEFKVVYKGRQMETSKTDAVQEVSSMTSNDTVKEDDHPSRALPCQLPPKELSPGSFALPYTIDSFILYVMADLGTCVNIIPNSVFEYLKLTNIRKTDMLVRMDNITQQAPLGTMENVLVKIDKFVFPCNFVGILVVIKTCQGSLRVK
ncbi:phospholipase-like protein [Tanacetum coccineum]